MAFEELDFKIKVLSTQADRALKKTTAAIVVMGRTAQSASKKARKAFQSMADPLKDFGKKASTVGRNMTTFLTLPILAVGTASVKMASDAAESFAKFETVFGSASGEMDAFITQLQKSVPATRTQLRDMTSSLQDLLVPIGIIPSDAREMSRGFVTLASDLASFNNVPIAQALNALRSGIIGQSEPLTQFGVDVRVAATETKALELGLIAEGEQLNNAARAFAVLEIATEQSTFAIGDAERTANETANQFKFFSRNVKELAESLGTTLLPKVNTAVSTINAWLERLRGTDSATLSVITSTGLIVAALGPLVFIAGKVAIGLGALAASGAALTAGFIAIGSGAAVVAVAIGAWKFGRWLSGITGVDKAIQRFAGSEAHAAREANEFKKGVLSLNTHLRSQGVVVNRNGRSWDDWFQALSTAERQVKDTERAMVDLDDTVHELTSSQTDLIREMRNSLNPSTVLTEKIRTLEGANFSAKQIIHLLSKEMQDAITTHANLGSEVDPLILKYSRLASQVKTAGDVFKTTNDFIRNNVIPTTQTETVLQANLEKTIASVNASTAALIPSIILATAARQAANQAAKTGADVNEIFKDKMEDLDRATKANAEAAKDWGDVWSRQVSTIVTDFSKGVVDVIFEGRNLKDTLVGIFKEMGKTLLRTLIEGLFDPLKGLLKRAGKAIGDLIGKALGLDLGGSSGGVASISLRSIGGATLGKLAGAAGLALGGIELGKLIGGVGGAAIGGAAIGAAAGIGFGSFLGVGASVFGPFGAVAGAIVGSIVGLFNKIGAGRKEADKIVVVQNKVTEDFASILDSIRASRASGTLTSSELINAITAVQLVTDAFFDFTHSGFKTAAAPQARETIGPLALSIIKDLNSLLDNFRPSITALAHGGIVTQPTLALIGEAGPEAVIPLPRMPQVEVPKVEGTPSLRPQVVLNTTVNVHGDINSEFDFEDKVARAWSRLAGGGSFSDFQVDGGVLS